jgi:hypothetical protein
MEIKDITQAFRSWYVIDGNEHLKINSFDDAVAVMEARSRSGKPRQLIMMSDKEYSTYRDRKTKRGKNS